MADGFGKKRGADSALNTTTASSDYNTVPSEEEITLFAPFEPHKASGKRFQQSSELETSDPGSKEIELPSSQSQTGGNATVIFKKLFRAGVSSGTSSTSSYSPASTPSPAQQSAASNRSSSPGGRPGTSNVRVNVLPPEDKGRFRYEGRNSSSVSSSNVVSSSGGRLTSEGGTGKSQLVSDDPRISLTSYSDAHRRAGKEEPRVDRRSGRSNGGGGSGRVGRGAVNGGGGSGRVGGGAVNKTEMLKRFGTIANSKVQDTNTDLRKYWMPDKACKECSNCSVKFGVFIRRHHCRICGRIFCHACCSITIPGEALRPDLQGNLRTCRDCFEVFTELRRSKGSEKLVPTSDSVPIDHIPASSLSSKLGGESPQPVHGSGNFSRTLSGSRPSMNVLSPNKSWDEASSMGRSQEPSDISPSRTATIEFDLPTPSRRRLSSRRPTDFDGLGAKRQRESIIILDEDEVGCIASAIWSVFLDPATGLPRTNHRHRLRTFSDSYNGMGVVNWLLANGYVASRQAGVQVGQALVDTKRLRIVSSADSEFRDEINQFIELGEAAYLPVEDGKSPIVRDAPKWFQHLPQESDSEYEAGPRYDLHETYPAVRVRLGPTPSSNGIYDHSVTLSSISKLTTSHDESMPSNARKPSNDDYLVVDELLSKSHESSMPSSRHSSLSPVASLQATHQQQEEKSTFPDSKLDLAADIRSKHSEKPGASEQEDLRGSSPAGYTSPGSKSLAVVTIEHGMPCILDSVPVNGVEATEDDDIERSSKTVDEANAVLQNMYNSHFDSLMCQIIRSYRLSMSWLDILRPLIFEATQTVRTDVFAEDLMDINEYIRVKKIPCGEKMDSTLTYGVVCSKNVTHRKMQAEIAKPTILLLKCSFDFMRHENCFASFDTLHTQELEYLHHLVDRVRVINPSIILVQKSVSRLALEDLFNLGVVVAVNVKPSIMRRVARCTGAEIMTSVAQLAYNVRLGTCGKFYLRTFSLESGIKKTFMYFDVCKPQLGCVITLQGGSNRELKKVKKVTQFGLHLAHNSILETAFLLDENAWPGKWGEDKGNNLISEPYESSCVTPEIPLYPSLAHPLESLPPTDVVKRLESLGLCGRTKIYTEKEAGENKQEGVCHEENSNGESVKEEEQVAKSDHEGNQQNDKNHSDVEGANANDVLSPSITDPKPKTQSPGQLRKGLPTKLQSQDSEMTIEPQEVFSEESLTSVSESDLVFEEPDPTLILQSVGKNILADLGELEFRAALDRQLISISPRVRYSVPYLQTSAGRHADIRKYLSSVIYWSVQFSAKPRNFVQVEGPEECIDSPTEVDAVKDGVKPNMEVGQLETTLAIKTKAQTPITQTCHHPSYKSVSEHPLTSSFLLLRANTNEMQAALADFRARAGLAEEDNSFFFKSAKLATDYRLLLQNVFNKYKQFEIELEKEDTEDGEGGDVVRKSKKGWKKKRKQKRKWWKRRVKENRQNSGLGENGDSGVLSGKGVDKESDSDSDASENEGEEGVASESNMVEEHKIEEDNREVGRVSTSEERDEQDGIVRMASRSREHTPGFSKSGKAGGGTSGGQEVGAIFGNLGDMDQKKQSSSHKSTKDVGRNMPTYDLDMEYSETWMAIDQYTDCLDPIKHQGISILFSNTCHEGLKQQRPCLPPCIIPMFYYGQNDIAVGDFLQRYCFKEYYKCPICSIDMAKHIRHIIHGTRSIHIEIRTGAGESPSNRDENIYTWQECQHCSNHSTPYTVMAPNSLIFSFAKFLELKFYSDSYVTRSHGDDMRCSCPHRLHPDYVQYFKYKNKLAVFRPSTVDILEVLLPPTEVVITTPSNRYLLDYASEIKHVGRIVEGVFCRIRQKLDKYRLEPVMGFIDDHISNSRGERDAMRTKVSHLKELMVREGFVEVRIKMGPGSTSSVMAMGDDNMTSIQDCLEDLKRSITEVVECWNILLEELDCRVREYRRKLREGGGGGNEVAVAPEHSSKSPRESPVALHPVIQQIPVNPLPIDPSPTSQGGTTPSSGPATPSFNGTLTAVRLPSPTLSKKPPVEVGSDTPLNQLPILRSRKLMHRRNSSDGGVVMGGASGSSKKVHKVAMKKKHQRNLSDSMTAANVRNTIEEAEPLSSASSRREFSSELTTPNSISPAHRGEPASNSPSHVGDAPYGPGGGRETGEETVGGAHGQDVKKSERPPASIESQSSMQTTYSTTTTVEEQVGRATDEDSTYIDTSNKFLSKFRPREQEWRDDPTKYYLLDPSLIVAGGPSSTTSHGTGGGFSGSGSNNRATPTGGEGMAVGGVSGRAVPSKKSRKSVTSAAISSNEGESGKGEKKAKDKERLSILSRPFQRLPPPLDSNEHHTMPSCTNFPISIYEKEPTSVIAYALSSRHYTYELKLLREKKAGNAGSPKLMRYFSEVDRLSSAVTPNSANVNGATPTNPGGPNTSKEFINKLIKKASNTALLSGLTSSANHNHTSEYSDPYDLSGQDVYPSRKGDSTTCSSSGHSSRSGDLGSEVVSSSTGSGLPPNGNAPGSGGNSAGGGTDELDQGAKSRGHISLEFSNPDKTANFFCKVYFANEFQQLRERIFPAGEDKYIRSLTRCVKFEAKGGKSRSAFCKVADDRFILKQIKSIEISAFEDFAPRYLDYINKALDEKRPLALAKIFGAYSIGFKNSKTGSSKRMDVIIMENLLYDHSIARVFDLKGSMRSRYVDPSKDSSSDVLLDENYLNSICHAPVYVHPHSKFVLMQALTADSEFLAHNSIMDYSLLTCIDENTGMLVVGIIDYVRTFTFDKRLEMYLKKTSGRELPTVVYPELYRKRFCEAMERYFTVVPDKWSGLGMDF